MGMPTDPNASLPAARQHGGLTGALKANQLQFQIASIILLHDEKEDPEMNIQELRSKSAAEIRDIYNSMADRHVKRFADRVEAERRTAQLLQENGKWEGDLPNGKAAAAPKAASGKKGKGAPAPAPAPAPAASGKGGKTAKSATKTTTKPAPKAATAKKSNTRVIPPRGAPRSNLLYFSVKHDKRMNEGSARTIVFKFIESKGAAGIDREAIENNFVDNEDINVKASLDYLVKFGMLKTKDVK